MLKNRLLSILLGIAIVILTVTFSIGLPIYIRNFYYMQIEPLGIPERTGYTVEEIRDSYDEVLDYLTLPGKDFGTGVFRYSEEGKSHFADCKSLFTLNAVAFLLSLAVVVTCIILSKKKLFKISRPFGLDLTLICGSVTLALFATIGILVAVDFDAAFVVFHSLFFPGKDNWVFDSRYDEIIRALPADFFASCALLIGGSVILLSLGQIAWGIYEKLSQRKMDRLS